ncbi:GNAT family N-acetyltransferase [Arthrobacter sp. NamB2]|uniref:GNAT family N-acetyltransferase n=1 Tax=Arthrobacter sp. NamB2 TaxID=2576035 RepID=UPI0010CA1D40|nr:GNAT family N-acetyltransferase [Arthrobacter sp. NamB2]TKV27419.1 GNAT family N-acetyltransferase [Arthrobacter sp. NamB2]
MDPTQISVRPAVDHDAPRLAEIHIAAWRATYRGIMSDERLDGMSVERAASNWRQNIADPAKGIEHLLVAHDDLPVGFAILGPAPDDYAADTGQLHALNLHPDWWAQGLGSRLFTAFEQRLAALGYAWAFLWVAKGNERAISFYTKHGWLDDGGILEDAQFDPPIIELRHSRTFAPH